MANNKKQEKEVFKIEHSQVARSEDFVNLYVNNVRFGYSKWDIQMICARTSVSMDVTKSKVEEVAVISMSPQHAKAVLQVMQNNLHSYEAEHGEIIMPKEDVDSEQLKPTSSKKKTSAK